MRKVIYAGSVHLVLISEVHPSECVLDSLTL